MYLNKIIDGAKHASEYLNHVKAEIYEVSIKYGVIPTLRVILIGNNHASQIYVRNKIKKAMEVGINVDVIKKDEDISQAELLLLITHLNNDPKVHGILVQLPLPQHINTSSVINTIDPLKDVDGFSHVNVGKLSLGHDCLASCTPLGIMYLLHTVLGQDLSGKKAVVIGRSNIVGRPIATMLLNANCTVEILHSRTISPYRETKTADILIAATGTPRMVKASWVKYGACVIDVGINREVNTVCGDVDFASVIEIASYITPVPGGVGPMTIACLLGNVVKATKAQCDIQQPAQ